MPPANAPHAFRYYDLILAAFVTVLLSTNLITAGKPIALGPLACSAGVLFFPLSYLFGDILTEVYGYARSRKVVWCGFGALAFAVLVSQVVLALPGVHDWTFQAETLQGETVSLSRQVAWQQVFGAAWRIVAASMIAYFAGEFANSFTLAKMKVWTKGRLLWTRTIGSTIVGEAFDSALFYPIAFLGVWPAHRVMQVMAVQYTLKVLWEVLATPLTYRIVNHIKRVEKVDHFDTHTNFTPFSLDC